MSDLDRDIRNLIDGSPTIDADEIRTRGNRVQTGRRPSRRPLVAALAVAVLMVLVVAGVALLRSGGSRDGSVIVPVQPAPAPAPDELVAITADGRVVVLDTTGRELRTLAEGADPQRGQLSVAPDGAVYFFDRTPMATIVELPAGGAAERNVMGQGCCIWFPLASPDGRWLAFSGVPNQSDAGRDILLQRRAGDQNTYERRWSGGSTLREGIEILAWTPDSSGVVFIDHDEADPQPRVLDIDTPQSANLDDQPLLELPSGFRFAGFRGSVDRMVLLEGTGGESTRVVLWDRSTGATQTVFALDGLRSVSIDPSGDHLLAIADSGLYRWSSDDATPSMIAPVTEGIVAAAWLPSPPDGTSTLPTTGTSDPPNPMTERPGATPPTTRASGPPPNSTAEGLPAVQVLNGSEVMGAATQRSNDLKAKGWQVLPAGNAPEVRDGTAIQCFDGYASAAAQLRADLRLFGVDAAIEPLPDPLPLGYGSDAACYVILGR